MPLKDSIEPLAIRLIKDFDIDKAVISQLLKQSRKTSSHFFDIALQSRQIPYQTLAQVVSEAFGIPFLELSAIRSEAIPQGIISNDLIREHRILPIALRNDRLLIAISEPRSIGRMNEVFFHTSLSPEAVMTPHDQLQRLIEHHLRSHDSALSTPEELNTHHNELSEISNDSPLARFLHQIILDAITAGASDIHFEPYSDRFRIRYRCDGLLREAGQPPLHLKHQIASRLKVMAHLDIAEKRLPQDGKIRFTIEDGTSVDLRISTMPTVSGEKVVLRILNLQSNLKSITALGMNRRQEAHYKKALFSPKGLILVTGPTGSGKTITLYSGLSLLNQTDKNIMSVEDPVEISIEGINQVNVNPATGLGFSQCLKSFLRQDPDIIMLGEIRDHETADIAVKSAQTGHLVLSTLHTNSARETLTRLESLGVSHHNIDSALLLIINQRLLRRLCHHCKTEIRPPFKQLEEIGLIPQELQKTTLWRASQQGCQHCFNGYQGRVGIYELLSIENSTGIHDTEHILNRSTIINTLTRSAAELLIRGITSPEEVRRVLG